MLTANTRCGMIARNPVMTTREEGDRRLKEGGSKDSKPRVVAERLPTCGTSPRFSMSWRFRMSSRNPLPDESEESAGGLSRRKFVLGATGAIGALSLGPAGAALAAGRRAGNTKQIAFAQPDTSFAGYPLLLQGCHAVGKSRGYEILESHANHQLS